NFSLCVGTTVPTSARAVEAPPALIEIHPQWRGQLYFIVDDRIIIVDRSHRIIAVLPPPAACFSMSVALAEKIALSRRREERGDSGPALAGFRRLPVRWALSPKRATSPGID